MDRASGLRISSRLTWLDQVGTHQILRPLFWWPHICKCISLLLPCSQIYSPALFPLKGLTLQTTFLRLHCQLCSANEVSTGEWRKEGSEQPEYISCPPASPYPCNMLQWWLSDPYSHRHSLPLYPAPARQPLPSFQLQLWGVRLLSSTKWS